MSFQRRLTKRPALSFLVLCLIICGSVLVFAQGISDAGFNRFVGAVGGVMIDGKGVVSRSTEGDIEKLRAARQKAIKPIAEDLDAFNPRRVVSLRKLEEAVAKQRSSKFGPLPDEIMFLAGLQRVEYVIVLPEKNDIVLMGPAEGWKTDRWGSIVGKTTGRPVLTLDDLIVALRTAESSNETGISCSIDPTPEGLQRVRRAGRARSPEQAAQQMEEALGPQVVTIKGVPATSYFARVMLAADYRMKRLAMNFEEAPVDGLPSYLHMMRPGRSGISSSQPRWWLAANYDPLLTDPDRLTWQLRGQGVKCMTETDFLTAEGTFQRGGGANDEMAKKWADAFTEKFPELAKKDSVFGQLRNVMDLAVVASLIAKEDLLTRADLKLPQLMEKETHEPFSAPRRVATKASLVRRGTKWLISASGGVQIYPWQIADRVEVSDKIAPVRQEAVVEASAWWK